MRCSLLAGFTDDGLLPVSIVQYPLRAWGRCPFAGNAVYVKATLHGYPRAACQPFQTMPVRHFLFFGILSAIAIKGPQVMKFQTLEATIGNTPLVRLQRLPGDTGNSVLVKLEGNNPAGSVKDRPALSMIRYAEARGEIRPGDTLIEATSGNTGIALAMVAATKGYRMLLVMPEHMSIERRAVMKAFGAEIILVSKEASMEGARDLALQLQADGKGRVLDQFSNQDNPRAHYEGTGPEIWRDTAGGITHFVSAMGTTGTIMGTSRYLKEQNPDIEIVGVTPAEGSAIPGIRRWPEAYLPSIFDASGVDRTIEVKQDDAEQTTLALAAREGIFAGISSGGAVAAALSLSAQVENAVIVAIICDRGDRYLSTGVFPD
jgi:cysteine synthase B